MTEAAIAPSSTHTRTVPIELRSDTFTLPTPQMLEAIVSARLGDDVYAEDPTVQELERRTAQMLGKDAACLMPSGTMANLASILAQAPRGTKILVGDESDVYVYEAAGASVCGGVAYEPLKTERDGTIALETIKQAFPPDPHDLQYAAPALLCLETPHNRRGGVVLPLEYLASVAALAERRGLRVHLDGARIFNAACALGVDPSEIARHAHTVQLCFSKGLAAPIGSIVVGDLPTVEAIRRIRKMLGGGMRQAGIVAAPALVALDEMVERVGEDHANARLLAEGLARLPGIDVELETVQTNTVVFGLADGAPSVTEFVESARRRGIRVAEFGRGRVRAVTHASVDRDDVARALALFADITRSWSPNGSPA